MAFMYKFINFFLMIYLCMNTAAAQETNATPITANEHVLAAWLWGDNSDASATPKQKKQYLLDLIKYPHVQREFFHKVIAHHINRIYLNVNTDSDGKFIFSDHHDDLKRFIVQAHARNIEVFALFGDTNYVAPTSHSLILGKSGLLEEILSFNRISTDGFDGIQSDIEPYYDGNTGTPTDLSIVGPHYLEITAGIAKKIAEHREESNKKLIFEAAIPFWYGMSDDYGSPAKKILFNGIDATIDWHVINLTDSVAVMAYRDVAAGENGVIALSAPTLRIAQDLGKKVLIALETQKPNPRFGVTGNLTLFEEGRLGLNRMLAAISEHYKAHPSYRGIALHHYDSLLHLNQGRLLDTSLLEQGIIWTKDFSTGIRLWDISGNYGQYGNIAKNNYIHSAEDDSRLRIDVDARGAWGSGVSILFSEPENHKFMDSRKFYYIDMVWCSTVEAILQLADARWHALDDSVPLAYLPKTNGKPTAMRISIGKTHPFWGTAIGDDPKYIYSGSDEYGWIDRSQLASMFLRIPATQRGAFELIDMRFSSDETPPPAASGIYDHRSCKPDISI